MYRLANYFFKTSRITNFLLFKIFLKSLSTCLPNFCGPLLLIAILFIDQADHPHRTADLGLH